MIYEIPKYGIRVPLQHVRVLSAFSSTPGHCWFSVVLADVQKPQSFERSRSSFQSDDQWAHTCAELRVIYDSIATAWSAFISDPESEKARATAFYGTLVDRLELPMDDTPIDFKASNLKDLVHLVWNEALRIQPR